MIEHIGRFSRGGPEFPWQGQKQRVTNSSNKGALEGIQVLDMTSALLGPYATQILGDLGADVIKIEPPQGDLSRKLGPARSAGMTSFYLSTNRNKRSLVLDLTKASAREVLEDLIRGADVLIHNVRLAGIKRLGFDYESVKALNPSLVYVHAVGFGEQGAWAGQPAYDNVIQAESGAASLMNLVEAGRDETAMPNLFPSLLADKVSGLHGVYAMLAGLLHKERTGRGQAIEVPMFEAYSSFLLTEHLDGQVFDPPVSGAGADFLLDRSSVYQTLDGHITISFISLAGSDHVFALADKQSMLEEARFASLEARVENRLDYFSELANIIRSKTTAEWLTHLKEAHIPCGDVVHIDTVIENEHLNSVGFFERHTHPTEGDYVLMKHPVTFSDSPASLRRHAARLGDHGVEILKDLGRTAEDIEDLLSEGALFVPDDEEKPT